MNQSINHSLYDQEDVSLSSNSSLLLQRLKSTVDWCHIYIWLWLWRHSCRKIASPAGGFPDGWHFLDGLRGLAVHLRTSQSHELWPGDLSRRRIECPCA